MTQNPYKTDIGYIASRQNPLTNGYSILYDGKKTEPELATKDARWVLICAKHETVKYKKLRADAAEAIKTPEKWCDPCKNLLKMEEAELILTLRTNRNTNEQLQRLAYFAINDPEKRVLFEELTGHLPEDYI